MGLIALLVTILIMILGMGYLFLGNPKTSLTVNNDGAKAPVVQEITQGMSALDAARDVKKLVEQKAADTMKTAEDPTQAPSTTPVPKTGELKIVNRLMASGFSVPTKTRTIDTVVLHSSYDLNGSDPYSVSGVIKEYTEAGVSAHYLIDRGGTIYRLVADQNIAYHAGVSQMSDGRTNVNDFSIGVEMLNTETGQFTDTQYTSVNALVASLKKQYPIKSVVGHADIAPGRKTDPWNFDWKKVK
jgi:N-acetyl-anhydromuramyl-L-alanine amidase AmpD